MQRTRRFILPLLGCFVAACGGGTSSPSDPGMALDARAVASTTAKAATAPPPACGTNVIASNASGAEVLLASDAWNGSTWVLDVCATTDGVHWSGPTAFDNATRPAAVIAPNGRAVLVWSNEVPSTGAFSILASILPPGGSWRSPATLSVAYGVPSIKMDSSGNALAMWASEGTSLDSPVQTAVLAASTTAWTTPLTLASFGGLAALVGNAAGDVLVTWRTRTTNDIQGAAGTILGGFRPTVTFSTTNGYVRNPAVPAINSAGDAVVAWESTFTGTGYATMTLSGTWSAATQLSSKESLVTIVINAAGNFVLTWTAANGDVEMLAVS
jgi:hypothetical protein